MTTSSVPTATGARSRLQAFVEANIEADGSLPGHCESRVLESTLCLHLLRRRGAHPKIQRSLGEYLRRGEPDLQRRDPLQHCLRELMLGNSAQCDVSSVQQRISEFDHYTVRRKRVLFNVLLAELGGTPFSPELTLEDFDGLDGQRHHSWVALAMRSLKVLAAFGLDRPSWVTEEDVEILRRSQAAGEIWEKHLLANVLALLALRHFAELDHEVRAGIDRLVAHQNADGGFPFITGIQVFSTATAGLALTKCGASRELLTSMANYLVAQQRPNGGWSYAEGVQQTDVDDASYCIQFLREFDASRYASSIARGESYLVRMQNEDGGFPTFLAGCPSEVAMTAAALNAVMGRDTVPAAMVERGVRYILDHQRLDGTFERSWSLSQNNAIFRALMALHSVPLDSSLRARCEQASARAHAFLEHSQNEDGGWGQTAGDPSDPISTAYGLIASSQLGDVERMLQGMRYLRSRQGEGGEFVSIPDQAGPRPIPWNVPILADIFVLMAFGHVSAALRDLRLETGT